MNSRTIGKITSVGPQGIIADIYDEVGNYSNTIDGIRFVGEVGSYVSVYEFGRTIVAEIVGVEEKLQVNRIDGLKKPNSKRQLLLNLVGEITEAKFTFGVSKMPLIFSEVYIISENDLRIMLEVGSEEVLVSPETENSRAILLPIGESVLFPDYDVKINIDKFFGFHFAVLGNTGAGKSNTLAHILQTVFRKTNYSAKGAKFIVIDSNGEYNAAFSKLNEINSDINYSVLVADMDSSYEKLQIPVWALSPDDWAVLLNASEKTQIPVLKKAVEIARIFFDEGTTNNNVKNHILASTLQGVLLSSDSTASKADKVKIIINEFYTTEINKDSAIGRQTLIEALDVSYGEMKKVTEILSFLDGYIDIETIKNSEINKMVPYDLDEFVEAVRFATLYEGSVSSQRIQEYTSTLMTRLQAIRDGEQGRFLTKTSFSTVEDYIDNLFAGNQILDIDVSSLDDASAEVVTKVIAKLVLDYLKHKEEKASMPVNFIIEEAHRYVKNESNYGAIGYNIFERISKEGRKYGLLLGVSSQRPSELSKTVVSQCSNFIIHRIQNPDDLQYISKMVPYVNRNIIERLTYLPLGNALVFGSSINLPTLTKFTQANPKTDSDNARISEKWYIE